MTKKMVRKNSVNTVKGSNTVGGYKVLGETRDGVRILEPKSKPQSFTVTKLKKAIRSARTGKVA